jgi:hypothetical protein
MQKNNNMSTHLWESAKKLNPLPSQNKDVPFFRTARALTMLDATVAYLACLIDLAVYHQPSPFRINREADEEAPPSGDCSRLSFALPAPAESPVALILKDFAWNKPLQANNDNTTSIN